jgi:hypothetical protein
MPAEPQRETIHKMAHMLLDGLRILRDRGQPYYDADTLAALDRAIDELMPMEGFPILQEARMYGLAHGLRVLVEDVLPHVQGGPVDPSEFPETLRRVEAALLTARDRKLAEGA